MEKDGKPERTTAGGCGASRSGGGVRGPRGRAGAQNPENGVEDAAGRGRRLAFTIGASGFNRNQRLKQSPLRVGKVHADYIGNHKPTILGFLRRLLVPVSLDSRERKYTYKEAKYHCVLEVLCGAWKEVRGLELGQSMDKKLNVYSSV